MQLLLKLVIRLRCSFAEMLRWCSAAAAAAAESHRVKCCACLAKWKLNLTASDNGHYNAQPSSIWGQSGSVILEHCICLHLSPSSCWVWSEVGFVIESFSNIRKFQLSRKNPVTRQCLAAFEFLHSLPDAYVAIVRPEKVGTFILHLYSP